MYKQVLPRTTLLLVIPLWKFENNIEFICHRIPGHGTCRENLSRSLLTLQKYYK